jgi:Do/DeqQ family serine protease
MKKPFRVAVLFFAAAMVFCGCQKKAPSELNQAAPPTPLKAEAGGVKEAEGFFIRASKEVSPSVVNISSAQKVSDGEGSSQMPPGHGTMPKDRYHGYGGGDEKEHIENTAGSGVIISQDGYIITNAHVVSDATDIKVKLTDGREFGGKVIGIDSKTDLAVLKITDKGTFPAARLGDSSKLQTGQWAIAIGNPFGLDHTVTVGVVSGTGRANMGLTQYENFIQTDASINPGNSGGPLLSSNGEVIGINTAIMTVGQGIGFAIPINTVREISSALIEKGKVVRGWLGVGIQDLTPELSTGFGIPGKTGVLVNKIYPSSPAERAHFAVGDVITAFDGTKITGSHQLQNIVAGTKVGKSVDVKVLRDKKEKSIKVRIDEMNDLQAKAVTEKPDVAKSEALGITIHPVDVSYGMGSKGAVVVEVAGGSNAEKAGVMIGDLITKIGKDKVEGLGDFRKASGKLRKGDTAVLLIIRAKNPLYIAYSIN